MYIGYFKSLIMEVKTMAELRTIELLVRENKGKTTFKGNDYIKYTIDDSYGHYFTKLLKKEYKSGDAVKFAIHSYKGVVTLKAVE